MLHLVPDAASKHDAKYAVFGQPFKPIDKRVTLGPVTVEGVGIERDIAPARIERAAVIKKNTGLHQGAAWGRPSPPMLHSCCTGFPTGNGDL